MKQRTELQNWKNSKLDSTIIITHFGRTIIIFADCKLTLDIVGLHGEDHRGLEDVRGPEGGGEESTRARA